jgi:acid phosphatase
VTRRVLAFTAALLLAAGCGSTAHRRVAPPAPGSTPAAPTAADGGHSADSVSAAPAVPRFAHVVVLIEENHASGEIIGSASAPYLNSLAHSGALLTQSFAVTHPSEPNYLALFSGSTQRLTDDSCPHTYAGNNLGAQLRAHGYSFAGYAESLPRAGYRDCSSGPYARKHAPWIDFSNIPASLNRPMSAFPTDFTKLPRVAFVVPNLDHDMHDGTVAQADSWLRAHLRGYVAWAKTHNSLLVVTWDEDDRSSDNHIPGVLVGAHVRTAHVTAHVDHYTLLRTIETSFGMAGLGAAAHRTPLTGAWS